MVKESNKNNKKGIKRRKTGEDEWSVSVDDEEEKQDNKEDKDNDALSKRQDESKHENDLDQDDNKQDETCAANDDDDDDDDAQGDIAVGFPSDGKYRNKQRCLVVCSRGVTARYRHLLEDLRTLIPHHKKESNLDVKDGNSMGRALNDISALRSCNSFLFLECRKRQDCYMWLSYPAKAGPSIKFLVNNIHTMDELKLTGNCLKGSRPILSFDPSFDQLPHLKLAKALFVDIFGTPRGHPKAKPFVDRVMSFYYADERIWVRNYQILEQYPTSAKEERQVKKNHGKSTTSLVEIGPRFVLNPIRIFGGSMGGPTLYQNPNFVSPNAFRQMKKKQYAGKYNNRKRSQADRKERKDQIEAAVPIDPLASVFR